MEPLIVFSFLSLVLTSGVWHFSKRASRGRNLVLLSLLCFGVFSMAGCNANPAQMIDELIAIVAGIIPLATSIATVFFPGEMDGIAAGSAVVVAGLKELKVLIDDYHSSPNDSTLAKVQAGFADVQTNLTGLENSAHVKDPLTQKKLETIVNSVVQSLSALEASIFGKHADVVAAAQANAQSS